MAEVLQNKIKDQGMVVRGLKESKAPKEEVFKTTAPKLIIIANIYNVSRL